MRAFSVLVALLATGLLACGGGGGHETDADGEDVVSEPDLVDDTPADPSSEDAPADTPVDTPVDEPADTPVDDPGDEEPVECVPYTSSNVRVNSDSGGADQGNPSVAVFSTCAIYVAWDDTRNGNRDIYYGRSRDGGGSWSNGRINSDTGTQIQSSPRIGVDAGGGVHIAWYDHRHGDWDKEIYYAASGRSWENSRIQGTTSDQRNPALAVHFSGASYVVWEDQRSYSWEIYFALTTNEGWSWTDPRRRINDTVDSNQLHPDIALHTSGIIYVVWDDRRGSNTDIYFAMSDDGGASFSNPNIRVPDTDTSDHTSPAIAADSAGNVYVVWEDERSGDSDIYFTLSSDGGETWADPNLRVNTDGGTEGQYNPDIAVGPSGTVYVVWRDYRSGDGDIYIASSTDGGTTWTDPNVRVNDDTGTADQRLPALAVGPEGNVYVVWEDDRNGHSDIYYSANPL